MTPQHQWNTHALSAERLNALQGGRASCVLRTNAARISIEMVLLPLLAGFLKC
jgi:hypothetical protein